jgi:F0F1-type ATP synthase membrane subunit c/vacuolar-type H+-ATPase subunit K
MARAAGTGADFHQDGIVTMSQDATRSAGISASMWMAIGIAIGAGIGAAMDNLLYGVGVGIAIGAAMWAAANERRPDQERSTEPDDGAGRQA